MESSNKNKLVLAIIGFAIISRLIPHAWNFAPFGAIALFSAAHFENKKYAFIIPIAAAWISGVILNNTLYAYLYPTFTLVDENILWQALAYAFTAGIGFYIYKNGEFSTMKVIAGAIFSSVAFFILTNFGTWASGIIYPKTAPGLLACYTAAIPFYKTTLLGDLIYSAMLFGSFSLVSSRKMALNTVK